MKKFATLCFTLLFALILAACGQQDGDAPVLDPAHTFRILAGSELKDVADLVTAYGKTQGMDIVFEYTGTLDAVDRLAEAHTFDAVWISHGKYLQLVPAVKGQIKSSEKTMYSRVVLGVKPDVAKRLGWVSGQTGWQDVIKAAKAGEFHFAMTNPTSSNTGFVALAGLAAELSGKGDALTVADIPTDQLTEFFTGQTMTSGSSGVLAERFVANPGKVDGMINYESVIRTLATKGMPLEVIIPKEGVITADYPLMLLNRSDKGDFYTKLTAYIRSEPTQKYIATHTFRTPLSGTGSDEVVNELPFPGSLAVVDAILKGFLNHYAKPSSAYFLLDTSGSMDGDRLASMKAAMKTLVSAEHTGSARFSTFRDREQVHLTPFSSAPLYTVDYTFGQADNAALMRKFSVDIEALQADGGTSIFSSVAHIYSAAQAELKAGDRFVSIVLLTDGENTEGISLDGFREFIQQQGQPVVPVFSILYGDANIDEMQALATTTGGRMFDARKTNLTRVMKDIRTYQ